MTNVKERILQIPEYKGIGKEKFFEEIGATYGNFKGKSKNSAINSDVLAEITAKHPDINMNWVLTGIGDMILTEEKTSNSSKQPINLKVREAEPVLQRMPSVVTTDNSGRDNIVLVPVKAAAGYLNGYGDPDFIEKLPTYSLPNIQNGTFRMFQVGGHSMFPTLHNGSYVVGQFVENWVKDIKDDRVYVIISKNDGIIVKRCLNRIKKYGSVYCKSDNRKEYPSFAVLPEDIIEVWEYKMHLGFELPNPADLYDRVSDLEAKVHFLESKTNKTLPNNQ
ncbi:S24 family peptidase [Flavobacterium sp. DG1-102-2]|uniref:S24 family peptidase n=1 Tax=Flavobacterium sp. DG1-102-2 TaxID=3081663 RepID=UPI00294A01A0|nr:S24 family peptidase [Flavobacterium sp. DG1-102-2]MDV6170198.1 S24 family peptidase [Flavobacterium sp. DG1-102-2]